MATDTSPDLLSSVANYFSRAWEVASGPFSSENLMVELGAIGGAFALAIVLSLVLRPLCNRITEAIEERDDWIEGIVDWLSDNLFRLLLACLLWSASLALDSHSVGSVVVVSVPAESSEAVVTAAEGGAVLVEQGQSIPGGTRVVERNFLLIRALASLATLFFVSGALPTRMLSTAYFKVFFFVLAIGLVLNLVGLWVPVRDGLNEIKLLPVSESTETRVTVLSLLKGILAIMLMIPACRGLLSLLDRRVEKMDAVSPVLRVLISKFISVLVIILAVLFGISSLGVNLSALAVLGGAVGLGLGFGFQKVVSNLISGVILLTDRSIKPGDVIEVGTTYGWINKLSARYVSVLTRDGTEFLIPNETLITEKVTNWSFSDDRVRVRVKFGASYNADPREVMAMAVEAGRACKRVIPEKEPVCWMLGYGDSSIDFELRVWIRDPAEGIGSLRSEILLRLWDMFKARGIEIPFPQRDLHIRSGLPAKGVSREEFGSTNKRR